MDSALPDWLVWVFFLVGGGGGWLIFPPLGTETKAIYEQKKNYHDFLTGCVHLSVCMCLLNKCCLFFHLALMMDMCVFS